MYCCGNLGQFQIAYLAHCLCLVLTQFKVLPHSWGLWHFCLLFQMNWIMTFKTLTHGRFIFKREWELFRRGCQVFEKKQNKKKNIQISKLKSNANPPNEYSNNRIFWSSPSYQQSLNIIFQLPHYMQFFFIHVTECNISPAFYYCQLISRSKTATAFTTFN